jgi:hypothetical protein
MFNVFKKVFIENYSKWSNTTKEEFEIEIA